MGAVVGTEVEARRPSALRDTTAVMLHCDSRATQLAATLRAAARA